MANTIKFRNTGRAVIGSFSNGKSSMDGWTWDGEKLVHPSKQVLRFSAEKSAELTAAAKSVQDARFEQLTGAQVSMLPEAERAQFKFAGVVGDVNGLYVRKLAAATYAVVEFGKADLV